MRAAQRQELAVEMEASWVITIEGGWGPCDQCSTSVNGWGGKNWSVFLMIFMPHNVMSVTCYTYDKCK